MGILNTNVESFDPLIDDIWEVWPQSWGNSEQCARAFGQKLLEAVLERAGYFHYALGRAVVATHIHNAIVPDEAYNDADKVAAELAKIVRQLEPSAKYITIKFGSSISGGSSCIPNIDICFDSEWFGTDFRTDKYGPWHQRHAKVSVHLKYKVDKFYPWRGDRPVPTYSDIYPAVVDWASEPKCHGESFKQHQHELQVFFPEGERYNYPCND